MAGKTNSLNTFNTQSTLHLEGRDYQYFALAKLNADEKLKRLPIAHKVLLENMLRFEDNVTVSKDDVQAILDWDAKASPSHEIQFRPSRVLLQDFTGVPAVVDLAVMRDTMADLGGDPEKINPLQPADLVIDHSVQVDKFGTASAFLIMPVSRWNVIASVTDFSDGARAPLRISGSSHQILVSFTRSIWNIWPRSSSRKRPKTVLRSILILWLVLTPTPR